MEQIDVTLERAVGASLPVSLLLIDLHGHLAGDRYLEQIARVIEESIPQSGIAARYGGDEFLVLLPGVDQEEAEAIGHALIERAQTSSHLVDNIAVPMGYSIDSATAPKQATTRDKLIKYADLAMYEAKTRGGGTLGQLPPQNQIYSTRRVGR